MKNFVVAALVALAAVLSVNFKVEARPDYVKGIKQVYEGKDTVVNAKCKVCHSGEDKKNRNDYGKTFGKSLGATKVKDVEKIVEAVKKAGAEKSTTEGKTWNDILESNHLPE